MDRTKPWKRYLRAALRDTRLLVCQFRTSLSLFALVVLGGGVLLWACYINPESGEKLGLAEAIYSTFSLIFFASSLPFPSQWYLQLFFFIVPLVGLGLIAEGVIRFGVMLFDKRIRKEAWQVAIASTYSGHTVVCGLGRVGYRVAEELLKFGEEVVGIEQDPQGRFVERLRRRGVPVIIGDACRREVLRQAGVERANAVIPCTENDLANLDIALDAREMNPHIKVVMRVFEADLARKLEKGFGIHTAFSTSALAAPAFAAAALRVRIVQALYVDDVLLGISEMDVRPGSQLVGQRVADLEQSLDMSVILWKRGPQADLHPAPEVCLAAGDKLVVAATLDVLNRLEQMNQ